MNKIILATVTGLLLTSSTALANTATFVAEDTMTSSGYDEISSNEVNWSFTAGLMARFDVPFVR